MCRIYHFDEIWHRHLEPETKEPFPWGSKFNNGIPYFYPILPQIDTYIMHFQWSFETFLWRCIAIHASNNVSLRQPTPERKKRVKRAWPWSCDPLMFSSLNADCSKIANGTKFKFGMHPPSDCPDNGAWPVPSETANLWELHYACVTRTVDSYS